MFTQSLKIIKSQTCLEEMFLYYSCFGSPEANVIHSNLEAGGTPEPACGQFKWWTASIIYELKESSDDTMRRAKRSDSVYWQQHPNVLYTLCCYTHIWYSCHFTWTEILLLNSLTVIPHCYNPPPHIPSAHITGKKAQDVLVVVRRTQVGP